MGKESTNAGLCPNHSIFSLHSRLGNKSFILFFNKFSGGFLLRVFNPANSTSPATLIIPSMGVITNFYEVNIIGTLG